MPEDDNLNGDFYLEIHQRLNIAQQILDIEQIAKLCARIISKGKIAAEDEREIFKALRILENLKKILQDQVR